MGDFSGNGNGEVAVTINDEENIKTTTSPPRRRSMLHRVPPQLRENKNHIYDPVAVPLGPYHHGRLPEFHQAEQLKSDLQLLFCGDEAGVLLGKTLERVEEIRRFYGGAAGFDDEELAEMMLRDACFVMCCMTNINKYRGVVSQWLGMSGALFMYSDVFMLENQIPLWIVNLLMSSTYEDGHRLQLCEYLSAFNYRDKMMMSELPWGAEGGEDEPLHLLEALHRTILHNNNNNNNNNNSRRRSNGSNSNSSSNNCNSMQFVKSSFRSSTDLRAKGVGFRPSSRCLKDIAFFSYSTHGRLHLPVIRVSHNSKAFLSNLVALEMSSDATMEMGVVRSVNFTKALLQGSEDVRILREERVLYSALASDEEEVVQLFRDIDTLGYSNHGLFEEVRIRIEEHCSDNAKTWMSEFHSTYFRSPWTLIALLAAAFILLLTLIQTYFAIYPRHT